MKDFSYIKPKSYNNKLIGDGILIFEKQLEGVEGHDIIIQNPNIKKLQTRGCIYNHLNPESTSKEDRGLSVRLEEDIYKGSYIEIIGEEYPYIALSDIDNHYAYKSCTLRRCDHKIMLDKDTYFYCISEGESYGVKISSSDDYLKKSDVKIKVTLQRNKLTESIPLNFRFCLGNSKHGIYKVSDITTYTKNLLIFTCQKDNYIEGYDDVENGLCWQDYLGDTLPTEYTISGQEEIKKSTTQTYTVSPTHANGVFELLENDGSVEIVSQDNSTITLKGLLIGRFDTIQYKINNEVVSTFDVLVVR